MLWTTAAVATSGVESFDGVRGRGHIKHRSNVQPGEQLLRDRLEASNDDHLSATGLHKELMNGDKQGSQTDRLVNGSR